MARNLITIFALWLLSNTWLWAQLPEPAFEHYTTDQGLGSDYINSLCKDRRGFLWVGTTNGLSRFDGLRFKTYLRQNTGSGLPGNYIVDGGLSEDKQGYIWVSTNKGVCRLDPIREKFLNIPIATQKDAQADNDYTSPVVFDQDGFGWFSSKYNLYRIDPVTLRMKAYPVPKIFDNSYLEPYIDSKGFFWVNQQGHLYRFDPREGEYRPAVFVKNSRPDTSVSIYRFFQNNPDEFLVIANRGVWRYDAQKNVFVPHPDFPELPFRNVARQASKYQASTWWFGMPQGGLATYLPGSRQVAYFEHSLYDSMSHNGGTVLCLYHDPKTGILWIGTDRGLEKVDPYSIKFKRKILEPALDQGRTKLVTVIRQDQSTARPNCYWITIRETGFFSWDRDSGKLQRIPLDEKNSPEDVYNVVQDKQGRLWIGMRQGVGRYTPETGKTEFIQSFLPPQYRSHEAIVVTYADREGRIWLGAKNEGLYWYNPEQDRILRWPLPCPPELGFVRRIQQDSRGSIWVQTGAGLYRIQVEKNITTPVSLHGAPVQPSDRLHSTFSLDRHDRLWVSGIGFLVQADTTGKILQTYTAHNGLHSDHVFSIIEDQRGNLWMSTDDRLHVLNPKTGKFSYYDRSSGLIEKMVFALVELTSNRQGELFMGFRGGFNYVHPSTLRSNPVAPPVVVTEVKVNNQPRVLPDQLVLQPGETSLYIQYTALSFSQPQEVRYAYQLEGFSKEWVSTNENSVNFTNLAPGKYTFRVRAANNDGLWSETGTSIGVEVVPAFWQTDWFRFLGAGLLAAILFAIFRYRRKQRLRLENIRNRIATDLHDDMGSTLSSIRIFSDVVQQQIADVKPEAVPVLLRISNSATNLSESMQDIVWTIQSNHDSLADLVTRMREFGLKMAEARGIDFNMDVEVAFDTLKLNLEQRRNIYLIFKESINNTIKYAQASMLDVSMKMKGRDLVLTIKDNGIGFDPDTVKPGNGLANLHKRAREIHGRMIVTSGPGQGTYLEMRLRL